MSDAPGTVSRILWHFTGGPTWNTKENKQNKSAKASADAYHALISIMETRELRVGAYKEIVRVRLSKLRRYDARTKKIVERKNVIKALTSAPVCSLADIPVAHLPYHSQRYGKFAIGFHRDAALKYGFNPVLYTVLNTGVVRSIYRGIAQLGNVDISSIQDAIADVASEVAQATCEHGHNIKLDVTAPLNDIELDSSAIEGHVNTAREAFQRLLAYVKTFERREFGTIYTEREWRSVKPFPFSFSDVAMIVLPRRVGDDDYFAPFVTKEASRLKLPRSIPIVPWDDLLEY